MRQSHFNLLAVILFVFALMAFSKPLSAYSAAFSLDYSIGFNGHFQLNTWTPVTVILENRAKSIRGILEVIVTSGSEYHQNVYPIIYTMDVELPHNSKKRYAVTVLFESFTHEVIIRLKQNNNLLISKSINLRPHFTERSFAVVADNFVSPDILSVMPERLFPVTVRPTFLPENWYGYDSVKLLIMKAETITRLRERQFQALTEWLKQGGYLLTSGGLNYGSLSQKRIRSILPLNVLGHKRLIEIGSFAHFFNQPLLGNEPFLVLHVQSDDADVLVKEDEIPIIIRKNIGSGKVIFLSFDYNTPPFSRWDGRNIFWDTILSMRPLVDKPGIDTDDQEILDSMLTSIPVRFQSFKSAVIFIGAYLVFLWFFQRRLREPGKRRWKNSLLLLMTIALFSAMGGWYFFYPNNLHKFTFNSFCQLDISGQNSPASAKYIIGLYALNKSAYSLNFGSRSQPVTHILSKHSKRKIPNPFVLQENHTGQQIVGSINKWSHSFYKFNSKIDAPFVGQAFQDTRHLTIRVDNKLPYKMFDCLVYFKKRFIFIDDILGNNQQIIKLKLSDLKNTEIFNDHEAERIIQRLDANATPSFLKTTQKKLTKELLFGIHAKHKLASNRVFLIGWVQAGVIHSKFKQIHPLGENLTLINWVLPVKLTS
jgi:hypothetical protein